MTEIKTTEIKTILNRSREFSLSSPSMRYLCTAVTKEHSAPASTKSDVLYNRLSALGKTGGSAIDTLNQYFSEGNYARKYELDTCIWQLRKFGKANHALQVCVLYMFCCKMCFPDIQD